MKVKILFDPDGVYGYPKGEIINARQLVSDYINCLNEVEDADTIAFLKRIEIEKAVDFVAEMWRLNYEIVPLSKIRRCAVCGKLITEGFLWDDRDYFCSKECGTIALNNDEGCFDILCDDGRIAYYEDFPESLHFHVNVNHHSSSCFHYFDNEARMFDWISEKTGTEIRTFEDAEKWGDKRNYCEILYLDPKTYYQQRKEYVSLLNTCSTLMYKAQCARKIRSTKHFLYQYGRIYDDANWYWDMYPEVWQGEI